MTNQIPEYYFYTMKGSLKSMIVTEDPYRLFRYVSIVFLTGIVAGTLFYGEPFRFWDYPYSYLGTAKTISGYSNLIARVIFDMTLVVCSFLFLRIGFWYRIQEADNRIKEVLSYLGAAGAIIMLIPCDTHNLYHSIGSSVFVLVLWVFMQGNLVKIKRRFNRTVFTIMLLLTEGGLLPYAWAHLNNNAMEYPLQKIAVWGCFGALIAGSLMLDRKQFVNRVIPKEQGILDYEKIED